MILIHTIVPNQNTVYIGGQAIQRDLDIGVRRGDIIIVIIPCEHVDCTILSRSNGVDCQALP